MFTWEQKGSLWVLSASTRQLPRTFIAVLVNSGGHLCSAFPFLVKQETSVANFSKLNVILKEDWQKETF